MIDAYKNLLILNRGDYCLTYKDGAYGLAFRTSGVEPWLVNLLQAAPVMYAKLDQLAATAARLSAMLEPVQSAMDDLPELKQLFTNLMNLSSLMRGECLTAMHAAEVGMTKAYANIQNSK